MERISFGENELEDELSSVAEEAISGSSPGVETMTEDVSLSTNADQNVESLNTPVNTREKRKEKHRTLEKMYVENKERIARFQASLMGAMNNNPDFFLKTNEEIFAELDIPEFILTQQREKVEKVLNRCRNANISIQEAVKQHPDPKSLYNYAFGREPVGRVEIHRGPVSIYFRCFDITDYAWILSQGFKKGDLSKEDIDSAYLSGGVSISTAVPEELKGLLIAENTRKKNLDWGSTRMHEEEHTVRRIINTELDLYPELKKMSADFNYRVAVASLRYGEKNKKFKELLVNNPELAVEYAKSFAQDETKYNCLRGADEVLAYFKDGLHTNKETYLLLTRSNEFGGLYDYFTSSKKRMKKWFDTDNPVILEAIDRYCDEEKKRYHKILLQGLLAVLFIYGTGRYSRDEVIALLDKEPLNKWPKISERIQRENNNFKIK